MKLVGFGCSFTFGSELQSPDIDPDDFWANTRYREQNCWLGQLAKRYNCTYDNLSQPANSNFAIGQQVAEYFRINCDSLKDVTVCIAWTAPTRMSWYDDHWTHNGFVSERTGWTASCKEWVTRHTDQSLQMFTENAKLGANSICKYYNVPLIQFNALGRHSANSFPNYLGGSMDSYLKRIAIDTQENYWASDQHPNELGHRTWVDFMSEWITSKDLL